MAEGAGAAPAEDVARWVDVAATAAAAKTSAETVVLEVGGVLAITGWFVVTSGGNPRLVKTLAEEVEERVRAAGGPSPLRVEGLAAREWILIDYGDFVVHVFSDDARAYYDLERLWADVPRRVVVAGGADARA